MYALSARLHMGNYLFAQYVAKRECMTTLLEITSQCISNGVHGKNTPVLVLSGRLFEGKPLIISMRNKNALYSSSERVWLIYMKLERYTPVIE